MKKIFSAIILLMILSTGCGLLWSREKIDVRIPVPTEEATKPIETSTNKISGSATEIKNDATNIDIIVKKNPENPVSKAVEPYSTSILLTANIVIATIEQLKIQIDALKEQLTTAKKAYDLELKRIVDENGAAYKLEIDSKNKEIAKAKLDNAELQSKLEKAIEDKEATEKILSSTVSKSWSYLSWLGMFMLVGGIIGVGICAYMGVGKKITSIISICGLACMITASAMPRIIVSSTTAFTWIVYAVGGSIAFLIILSAVLFILHGNLHELLDRWSVKNGGKDPRKKESQ